MGGKKAMKKLFALMLAVIMTLSLAACGNTQQSSGDDEMVEIAVKTAKEKGADAIVNFSIIKDKISEFNRFNGVYITGNTYYIQGYCIKRK